MTKKDYILVERAINHCNSLAFDTIVKATIKDVANSLALAMQAENSRFDTEKFLTACGLNN